MKVGACGTGSLNEFVQTGNRPWELRFWDDGEEERVTSQDLREIADKLDRLNSVPIPAREWPKEKQ